MANTHSATFHDVPVAGQVMSQSPARTAYGILHFTFTVAPIAGLDKFFHLLAKWDMYLAPWIGGILPLSAAALGVLSREWDR